MDIQNPENPNGLGTVGAEQALTAVPRRTQVLIGAVVVASLVPAAYLGRAAAIGIAQWSDTSGPMVSILLVAIAGAILGIAGAVAFAVANRWPKGGALVDSVAVLGLAALSVWMLMSLPEAGEALMVFGLTAVGLALMAGFFRLFGGK